MSQLTFPKTIVGKAINPEELTHIPEALRFSVRDNPEFGSLSVKDVVHRTRATTFEKLDVVSPQQLHFQCPVGPHDDPGLDAGILWACGLGPASDVAVQCSQGHWAQYPCAKKTL